MISKEALSSSISTGDLLWDPLSATASPNYIPEGLSSMHPKTPPQPSANFEHDFLDVFPISILNYITHMVSSPIK